MRRAAQSLRKGGLEDVERIAVIDATVNGFFEGRNTESEFHGFGVSVATPNSELDETNLPLIAKSFRLFRFVSLSGWAKKSECTESVGSVRNGTKIRWIMDDVHSVATLILQAWQ